MTAVEGRLRAVACALAESVPDDSIPPLRLPQARRRACLAARSVPLAAAMAIVALTWMAGLIGARITDTGALSAATGHSLADRSPVASAHPLVSSPPASVPSHSEASRYSLLFTADIKGPRQRSLLDPELKAMAASVPDSAAYSASSLCAQSTVYRQDVCTLSV